MIAFFIISVIVPSPLILAIDPDGFHKYIYHHNPSHFLMRSIYTISHQSNCLDTADIGRLLACLVEALRFAMGLRLSDHQALSKPPSLRICRVGPRGPRQRKRGGDVLGDHVGHLAGLGLGGAVLAQA